MSELKSQITAIDHQLSKRPIALDPAGYFIIYLDREAGLICAKHYSNIINEKGLAVDPDTGKVIGVRQKLDRNPESIYTARTAKELAVKV
ncbi:MAG: DUF4346 domain-containing protein, partial [Microcystis panniformis WG22]|nr:DUF4346 domain-containing protein [Microcystis panniformis WG22]